MTAAVERAGAVPAITAVVGGQLHAGARAGGARALPRPRRRAEGGAPATCRWRCAQGADGATTVAASLCIARAARRARVRHRRHRRRAPRRALRRVRRPRGARAVADGGRVRRRQVHPRPARHPRAAGDARRDGGGLPDRRAARLLHARHRAPAARAGRQLRTRSPRSIAPRVALGRPQAMLVVQPPPEDVALPRELVDEAVAERAGRGAGEREYAARR